MPKGPDDAKPANRNKPANDEDRDGAKPNDSDDAPVDNPTDGPTKDAH